MTSLPPTSTSRLAIVVLAILAPLLIPSVNACGSSPPKQYVDHSGEFAVCCDQIPIDGSYKDAVCKYPPDLDVLAGVLAVGDDMDGKLDAYIKCFANGADLKQCCKSLGTSTRMDQSLQDTSLGLRDGGPIAVRVDNPKTFQFDRMLHFRGRISSGSDTGIPITILDRPGRESRGTLRTAAHVKVMSSLRGTDFLFVADDLHPVLAETAVGQNIPGDTLFGPLEQRIRQELVDAKILAFQKFNVRLPHRERIDGRINPFHQNTREQEKRGHHDSRKPEPGRSLEPISNQRLRGPGIADE